MFEEPLPYKYHNNIITINIKVVPKSNIKFGTIIQFNNNYYWKIYLNSEPKDGKANAELINIISKKFKTPKSNIKIINGLFNKYKVLQIVNVSDNFMFALKCLIFGN